MTAVGLVERSSIPNILSTTGSCGAPGQTRTRKWKERGDTLLSSLPVTDPSGIGAADPAREAGYKALTMTHSQPPTGVDGRVMALCCGGDAGHAADTAGGERTLRRRARPRASRGSASARAPPSSRRGMVPLAATPNTSNSALLCWRHGHKLRAGGGIRCVRRLVIRT